MKGVGVTYRELWICKESMIHLGGDKNDDEFEDEDDAISKNLSSRY